MADDFDDEILEDVSPSRRRFIKGVVAATAFSVPMVSSFDLSTLSSSSAYAQSNMSNMLSNGGTY